VRKIKGMRVVGYGRTVTLAENMSVGTLAENRRCSRCHLRDARLSENGWIRKTLTFAENNVSGDIYSGEK
jgi:hypothetical protein